MMAQQIDRRQLKAQMKEMLRTAQVSPRGMTCLYLALTLVLNLADSFLSALGTGLPGTFVSILTGLMGMVLTCGYVLYCMAIRRGERAEYLTLFDGFSFVGKVVLLNIVIYLFTLLWTMLFVIPGIIAAYRYRFALYNLYENPGIGVMEALEMSKQQTLGYKGQLFMLDLSYLGWQLLGSVAGFIQLVYIYSVIFPKSELLHSGPDAGLLHLPAHARGAPGPDRQRVAPAGGPLLSACLPVYGAGLFRHCQTDLRRGPGRGAHDL